MLEENPDSEPELRALVQDIQPALPLEQPSASNHTVAGNGDMSSYAAGPEHPGALASRSELAYSVGQGVGMLGAQDAFGYGHQLGELVPGGGRVPGLADRVGEFAPRGQGAGVLGTGRVAAHIAIAGDRVV